MTERENEAAGLRKAKALRVMRSIPSRVLSDWLRAFVSEGNALSFLLAVLTSYVGLQTAALPKIVEEAQGWANAALALGYVSIAWLIICIFRSPYAIWKDERRLGTWSGNRYTFREPFLVASILAKATGSAEFYKISFPFAAPSAFVYYQLEIENEHTPRALYSASLVGQAVMGDQLRPGAGLKRGGISIRKDMRADMVIAMKPEMVSQTFRVYCRSFTIGNPRDHDGAVGDNTPEWVTSRADERI